MALCASGEMSLAGSTAGRSVACELGLGGTTQICMDQAVVRTLAGKTTAGSSISMCDFYGKSSVPTVLGESFGGGFYTGTVDIGGGNCYYLIVAPNATGCTCCQWKTTRTLTSGTDSQCNGYANTRPPMENANHPAGNWTATRSIGGFSDWYLPAITETYVLGTNQACMPAGEGYNTGPADQYDYWSSTQGDPFPDPALNALVSIICVGCSCIQSFKDNFKKVRAVRRVPM